MVINCVDIEASPTDQAVQILKAKFGVEKLTNLNISKVIHGETGRLAFMMDFLSEVGGMKRPIGLVDAIDGNIILSVDLLTTKGESGGMNEAFCDMAGEAAKSYVNGSNDWMVGEQTFKGNSTFNAGV